MFTTTVMSILNYYKSVLCSLTLLNCNVIVTKHFLYTTMHPPLIVGFSSSVVGVTIGFNARIERIEAAFSGMEEDEGLYATYAMLHTYCNE